MTIPPHLSASSIALYLRCPEAFRLKYVECVDEPPSCDRAFGSAMHEAIAMWHAGRSETLPQEFCEAWERRQERELTPAGVFPAAAYTGHGIALASLYERAAPRDGAESEVRFWFMAREHGVTVPIIGYWDRCDKEGFDEVKTSAWPWREGRVHEEYQASLYAAAFLALNGHLPRRATYWLLSRQPKPTLTKIEYLPSEGLCQAALKTAARVEALIRADDYAGQCNGGDSCPCRATAEERAAMSFVREA